VLEIVVISLYADEKVNIHPCMLSYCRDLGWWRFMSVRQRISKWTDLQVLCLFYRQFQKFWHITRLSSQQISLSYKSSNIYVLPLNLAQFQGWWVSMQI